MRFKVSARYTGILWTQLLSFFAFGSCECGKFNASNLSVFDFTEQFSSSEIHERYDFTIQFSTQVA